MRRIELVLILCQYYFDRGKNIEKFTEKFNQYFKNDISAQTILFSINRFKNVDPSNNMKCKNDEYSELWQIYIENDRINELKELYRCFKKGSYIYPIEILLDDSEIQMISKKKIKNICDKDIPQERPREYASKGIEAYRRNREVVANALAAADYRCELNCSTELFIRKSSDITYTEAHHLVPLCFQDEFIYSLDVEANVVSLCPNCHRKIHYGADNESILKSLYEHRFKRLKKCNIEVSYEKLLLMYR